MKAIALTFLCAMLVSCANTNKFVSSSSAGIDPLNEQEEAHIAQVEATGKLLYEKDVRAARATDLLLSEVEPSDYPNFVGWVTYPNETDFTVSFYETSAESFTVIGDVTFSEHQEPTLELMPKREPSDTEISMVKAKITALESGTTSCSDRFNTVVVPSDSDDRWDVYLLAATTNPDLVQVGGHVKVGVSKDTHDVVETMPLAESCLALDKSGNELPETQEVSAAWVTHVVSPMPVAIHPYLSLLHDIRLAVSSERGIWMVSSGNIELM